LRVDVGSIQDRKVIGFARSDCRTAVYIHKIIVWRNTSGYRCSHHGKTASKNSR
jgi:hypothetical protein